MSNLHRFSVAFICTFFTYAGCHSLTAPEVAAVNGGVSIACSLAEGVALPAVLAPFAALEPIACAGLDAALAAELAKTAPSIDAGAGLGTATAAMTASGPKPALRVIMHNGQVCGLARVAQ